MLSLTTDLKNHIAPCQCGGTPDCTQCGCIASAGLKAVADYHLFGFVPLRSLYNASDAVGKAAGPRAARRVVSGSEARPHVPTEPTGAAAGPGQVRLSHFVEFVEVFPHGL